MRRLVATALVLACLSWSGLALSQTSVTATCKDGTDYTGTSRSGACRGHGGVQAFTSSPATAAPATPSTSGPPPVPRTAAAQPPAAHAGQVWVNTKSKVYHCPGTRYFGATKAGSYMTEAAAKAAGNRPDHGKVCFP